MRFDFPLYSVMFFAGGFIALFLTGVVYMRSPARGAIQLTCFGLSCALWSLAAGLESGAVTTSDKVLFAQIEYPGIVGAALSWLAFALDYSGSDWWKKPRNIILVGIIPLATLILVSTNNLHHWYWTGFVTETNSLGSILAYRRGFWYWVFVCYTYTVYIAGVFILMRFGLKNQKAYRIQLAAICIGLSFPFAGSIVYLLGIVPVQGLDLAPFSFTLTSLVYAFSLFRLRLLDVLPVARSTLVEKMPDGLVVVSTEGMIVDMNPAAEKVSGLARIEAMGNPAKTVWPEVENMVRMAGPSGFLDISVKHPGRDMYLDVNISPLSGKRGSAAGHLLVFRDVSERRKMEQHLRESELRYSTLVEQSNEGVLIIKNGVYVFVNRTITELTGYPTTEIIGKPVKFLLAVTILDRLAESQRARADGIRPVEVYQVELLRQGGANRIVDISENSIQYEGSQATLVSARDVTEKQSTQNQLEILYAEERELKNRLQSDIDKRSKYTQSLVQELKSPLTAISSSAEALEQGVKNEIYLALVKNIERASFNLDQRINELIELARGEVGMLKIFPVELDMAVLLHEIVSEMIPVAAGKGLVTLLDIPELPKVLGDRSRLRQVMTNFLSNAIKFTNRGSISVKASKLSDVEVLVQVIDTGRGMAAEEVENVFDPYRRKISAGHDMRGLGIGLALSKMFVELHKGRVWAESVEGKGSTFSFTIPVFRDNNQMGTS